MQFFFISNFDGFPKALSYTSRADVGVYVDSDSLFICSYQGYCHLLNSSRSQDNSWKPVERQADPEAALEGVIKSFGIGLWENDTNIGIVDFSHYMRKDETTIIAAYIYTRKGFITFTL